MREIFLIDGNAVGFASHSGQRLTVGSQQTQAVYGICRTLRAMQMAHPNAYKAMLWDGRSHWRIEKYPDYKANRESTPQMVQMREGYKSQRPFIESAVRMLGIDQMRSPNCEADDLAGALSQFFSRKGHPVRLISADKDWLQLVDGNVCWHDPVRDKMVTLANFKEQTDFRSPRQILDLKCLMGDSSDNIKGVGGIGEVGAKKLLAAYGSVDQLLKMAPKVDNLPAPWQKLVDNVDGRLDKYWLNRELMDLTGAAKPGVGDRVVVQGKSDTEGFRALCENLAFHSILSNFDDWIAPFLKRTP